MVLKYRLSIWVRVCSYLEGIWQEGVIGVPEQEKYAGRNYLKAYGRKGYKQILSAGVGREMIEAGFICRAQVV